MIICKDEMALNLEKFVKFCIENDEKIEGEDLFMIHFYIDGLNFSTIYFESEMDRDNAFFRIIQEYEEGKRVVYL